MAFLLLLLTCVACAQDLGLTDLRVQNLQHATVDVDSEIMLSWVPTASVRNVSTQAYRVVVRTDDGEGMFVVAPVTRRYVGQWQGCWCSLPCQVPGPCPCTSVNIHLGCAMVVGNRCVRSHVVVIPHGPARLERIVLAWFAPPCHLMLQVGGRSCSARSLPSRRLPKKPRSSLPALDSFNCMSMGCVSTRELSMACGAPSTSA